jgi:hypothetical protein
MAIIKTIFIIVLIIISANCFQCNCFNPFAPKLQGSLPFDQLITEQKTPEDVLLNFKYAYTFKDSSLYSNLLDSSFVFVYFDPNYETSGRLVSWGRDVDLLTTGRLFRKVSYIDLIWQSTILISNEPNDVQLLKTFHLSLINQDEMINISGNAIFSFKKNLKDSKWRITRWKDESDY